MCEKIKTRCIYNASKCQKVDEKKNLKATRQIDFWQKVFLHDSPCILGFVCSYYRQQIIVHQKVTYCWVTEKKERNIHTHARTHRHREVIMWQGTGSSLWRKR